MQALLAGGSRLNIHDAGSRSSTDPRSSYQALRHHGKSGVVTRKREPRTRPVCLGSSFLLAWSLGGPRHAQGDVISRNQMRPPLLPSPSRQFVRNFAELGQEISLAQTSETRKHWALSEKTRG